MNKNFAAFLSVMALSACSSGPMSWYKEGSSSDQAQRDRIACERQAHVNVPGYGAPTSRGLDAGSGSGVGDGLVTAERQTGYANDCMRAKGYNVQ